MALGKTVLCGKHVLGLFLLGLLVLAKQDELAELVGSTHVFSRVSWWATISLCGSHVKNAYERYSSKCVHQLDQNITCDIYGRALLVLGFELVLTPAVEARNRSSRRMRCLPSMVRSWILFVKLGFKL